MERHRKEMIAELQRRAALAEDAERERKLLGLAERLEDGDMEVLEVIEPLLLAPV